jgi:hypothetical protein
MRLFVLSVLFTAATCSAALAVGAGWHGPGWYIVMDSPVKNQALFRGAYHTQDDCMKDKPADHGAIQYECLQINNEPLDE